MVSPFYIKNKPLRTNGIKPKQKVVTLFGIGSLMTFGLKTVHINISRVQSLITLCGYENQTDLIQSFYIKKDPPNWMLRVTEHHHVKY